jgi:hypothetical protein
MIKLNATVGLGQLVGLSGTDELLGQINNSLSNSNFFNSIDDILTKGRQLYVTNIINPIKAIGNTIKNQIAGFIVTNEIMVIDTEDTLANVPSVMHLPILQYKPIRDLYDEGRIFGFGADFIPDGDPYGRLISNGAVEDVAEAMDKEGYIEHKYRFESTDPILTFGELDKICATREFVDKILSETNFDPTDMPNDKG